MSVGTVIAIAVAVAGFGLSVLTYWITQRRVRPVVICHEAKKRHARHEATEGYWVASVYLTNESTTSAFNVRFGIDMAGRHVPWKHARQDKKASRLNVLRPGSRHPDDTGLVDVFIDDRMLWDISNALGGKGDVDDGRFYWAYYQGPAGDWWYTANPTDRTVDFTIKRVRSRRFKPISRGNRELIKSIERGATSRTQAIRELNEVAAQAQEPSEETPEAARGVEPRAGD